ncbi:MAG: RHS repeat-associated core domain-containing protein [Candidatus Melainabacteria bacterium]|nr:RHS repeat-associated core domain-containing protein [Candidatus Melainabacteria bacterium]
MSGPSSSSQTSDANGNMTSDGTNSYAWDAENRLIKITYPGSVDHSQILYDATGIKGQITETVASTLTSTKQFVNSGSRICEERDASSAVTKKFFGRGQTISGSNYFYDFDHLGSVREMTDSSGAVQVRYDYSASGQRTKIAGALDSDFQYAGYYMHAPSKLNLTVYRAYSPEHSRWINRDPIEEEGGVNLYRYSLNKPTSVIDPTGLVSYELADFIPRLGGNRTAQDVRYGCVDVVNIAIENYTGVRPDRPENAPNTRCWIGPLAFQKASESCKECGVLWGKQGNGDGSNPGNQPWWMFNFDGGFNPNGGNNPFETDGGDFNYFAYIPGRGFGGMNHGAGPGQRGYFIPGRPGIVDGHNGKPFNTEMWCCTKK